MKTYRSLSSALSAYNRIDACHQALLRRLHRIALADRCPGDLFVGWDMPTLRTCRPDDYARLMQLGSEARNALAGVRWFTFVPALPMEFAA